LGVHVYHISCETGRHSVYWT